jgi:hypothetical protein
MGIVETFCIIGIFSIVFSIGGFAGFVATLIRQRRRRRGEARTTGKVVGLEKRVFNPGSAGVYCPVVEFSLPSGETVRFESAFGTMPASNQPGDSVPVLYDPNAPAKAEVDSSVARWLAPGCFFLFSAGSCIFSLLFLALSIIYSKP